MRGWQCYLCKGWKPKHHTETMTEQGKICQNCKSAEMIRAEWLREQKQNHNNNDIDE